MSSDIIPGTGIAVATDRLWSVGVFYQLLNGHLAESKHLDGVWTNESFAVTPIDATPLASVTYSGGKDIRVYYLDSNYVVQEFCFSSGKWFQGEIGKLNARATPTAGLAAVVHGDDKGGVHLRVYYQEVGSNHLKELANDGHWYTGKLDLAGALGGTNLAAVAYNFQNQTQIRLYYQAADLSLKEHGHNNGGWFAGVFSPGKAPAQTPISAVVYSNVVLQVFYRALDGHVVHAKNTGSWSGPIVVGGVGPGYKFAVLQWEDGKRFRLYYQEFSGFLVEYYSDDGGATWHLGSLKVK